MDNEDTMTGGSDNAADDFELNGLDAENGANGADGDMNPGGSGTDDADDFSLDGQDEPQGQPEPEQPEEDEPFALELPEGVRHPGEEYEQIFAQQAKASGLKNKQAAAFVGGVLKAQQDAAAAKLREQKAELVKEWGASYQANVKQARTFALQLADKAGVPREMMGVFASPMGFRLLHALSSTMAEPKFAGGSGAPQRSAMEEAEAMISDPSNPYYDAMYDTAHPNHRKAHERYDRLTGIR